MFVSCFCCAFADSDGSDRPNFSRSKSARPAGRKSPKLYNKTSNLFNSFGTLSFLGSNDPVAMRQKSRSSDSNFMKSSSKRFFDFSPRDNKKPRKTDPVLTFIPTF